MLKHPMVSKNLFKIKNMVSFLHHVPRVFLIFDGFFDGQFFSSRTYCNFIFEQFF